MQLAMDYHKFIGAKRRKVDKLGFDTSGDLNPFLFDWQRKIVRWSLQRGRAAIFAECGLGKTLQQLVWAEHVHKHTGKPVVIHTPVGVRQQTKREATKFAIDAKVAVVDEQNEIVDGINLINYEKLHKFNGSDWGGVAIDESQILKSFTGVTKQLLCERYERTPYKLACTATPAPNDHMELGNHSQFLGVLPSREMLSRWFLNDTMKAGGYRLRGHAQDDFWNWVSQWAVCVAKPSDIGGNDDGYVLPELRVERYEVHADDAYTPQNGFLFATSRISATTIHSEKRITNKVRCQKAADLANGTDGPCIVWCDTNYESDELLKYIPDAVEVRGDTKHKEDLLLGFAEKKFRVLLSKPSIAGLGMNYQHCSAMVFAGLSYSFEQYYQSVRRCWRFGQTKPVDVHIIIADSDAAVASVVSRKETDHHVMQSGMAKAMRGFQSTSFGLDIVRDEYVPEIKLKHPPFLRKHK